MLGLISLENDLLLDLIFMKHYATNRFLCIKVTKLRTGVGNAETSHLQCQNIQRALQVFYHNYKFSKSKCETGDNKKIECFFIIIIIHQLIYSLSSISWPSLKLLAVILFKIP